MKQSMGKFKLQQATFKTKQFMLSISKCSEKKNVSSTEIQAQILKQLNNWNDQNFTFCEKNCNT